MSAADPIARPSAAERTAQRLLLAYPARWRARYGDELAGLIVEMSGERRVPWRMRAEVARGGANERVRAVFGGGGDPAHRARDGAIAVMWAWAACMIAGAIVAKTSEHWQAMLPGSHPAASAAFTILIVAAVLAGLVVVAGIALTLPALATELRAGGWSRLRGWLLWPALLSVALVAATAGLAAWAHDLSAADRNGPDALYSAAFVAWGALGGFTLLAWTAAATKVAGALALSHTMLRAEAWLATAAAGLMAVITVASLVWWVTVAHVSAAALTGSNGEPHASAFVLRLIVAVALMLGATVLAAAGARRAVTALPELG